MEADPGARRLIRAALVCHSNVNRSVEAHEMLLRNNIMAWSYGAGTRVKMPGEYMTSPNIYDFGTPYADILADLRAKNEKRYTETGMIPMITRDAGVKRAPERFQDEREKFDLVLTYENRVYNVVVKDIESRPQGAAVRPVHVVNLDTTDSHEGAAGGARLTLDLFERIYARGDEWEDGLTEALDGFAEANGIKTVWHCVLFY